MLFYKGILSLILPTPSNPNPAPEIFTTLPPFRIEPYYDRRIWGRKSLRPWFPIDAPDDPIGEVWLTGDDCLVATGPATGQKLTTLFHSSPQALLGAAPDSSDPHSSDSPLLIKLLFAQQKLSVQVHPDDALAQHQGYPRGKTECWYVLDAEPGAAVAVGFKSNLIPTLTNDEIRRRALDGSLEESLTLLPLAKGEMILVDAGTVHSIFPGSVLLEVQEYSDTTYRLFDYGRPRPLHIEQSLEALKFSTNAGKIPPQQLSDRTLLIKTEFFSIESFTISAPITSNLLNSSNFPENSSPTLSYIFLSKGSALITQVPNGIQFKTIELPEHSILAIPASAPEFIIHPDSDLEFLRICAPTQSHPATQ